MLDGIWHLSSMLIVELLSTDSIPINSMSQDTLWVSICHSYDRISASLRSFKYTNFIFSLDSTTNAIDQPRDTKMGGAWCSTYLSSYNRWSMVCCFEGKASWCVSWTVSFVSTSRLLTSLTYLFQHNGRKKSRGKSLWASCPQSRLSRTWKWCLRWCCSCGGGGI